ncbi:MAG TPA: phosphoglycerate mutase family protein [Gaiellaceae bacterium]|nr:phosphoglycerate mutase family protein [Gaiellaceae bacterium]
MSFLLLRHASAGDRDKWAGDDRLRLLDEHGRQQALMLRDLLRHQPITRIVSSPYIRCVATVEPLAGALSIEIELDTRLAEGTPAELAQALLEQLDGGLACTHGDVIEAMLGYPLRKGAAAVVDVGCNGAEVLETLPAP